MSEGSQVDNNIENDDNSAAGLNMMIDYNKKKVSTSFNYLDAEMHDSDCSEDYDNDDFF